MRGLGRFRRRGFGYAFDVDVRAGRPGTLGDGVRHRFHMTIGRVIKNQYFCHESLEFEGPAAESEKIMPAPIQLQDGIIGID
jgi:hypothetical protein